MRLARQAVAVQERPHGAQRKSLETLAQVEIAVYLPSCSTTAGEACTRGAAAHSQEKIAAQATTTATVVQRLFATTGR
jgi:hypothetical protein